MVEGDIKEAKKSQVIVACLAPMVVLWVYCDCHLGAHKPTVRHTTPAGVVHFAVVAERVSVARALRGREVAV
jgi:hypothetical protein